MPLSNTLIYPVGSTAACRHASAFLKKNGYAIIDHPAPEITHLLLDIPSFQENGILRGGGDIYSILSMLPRNITVIGGNLDHPALDGYRKLDLLRNEQYLAQNASITAHCALQVAAPLLRTTFTDTPTLIIGWGRIGKCLARLLKSMDCSVTVAARKNSDRAILSALGYPCITVPEIPFRLQHFKMLFNTVPIPLFSAGELLDTENCTIIELSSVNALECRNAIIARGLPGTLAPESSGKLIAQTIITLWKEEES